MAGALSQTLGKPVLGMKQFIIQCQLKPHVELPIKEPSQFRDLKRSLGSIVYTYFETLRKYYHEE